VKRCVMFTFSSELATDPIIYNLGMQFRLVTTIRRANITEEKGWIALELEGEEEDIEQAIAWVNGKGVRVDPADDLMQD
jgi:ABC-type methionine transport system ATPase subunit